MKDGEQKISGTGTVTNPDSTDTPAHSFKVGDTVYQSTLGKADSAQFTVLEDHGHVLLCEVCSVPKDGDEGRVGEQAELNPAKLTKVRT